MHTVDIKAMRTSILFLLFQFSTITIFAQTGIGTTTPHASAKLDVAASNKGFLPPRINLTDAFDQTTIPSPATGLLVYCNGGAGLNAGYYYWNGTNWATIATAGGSGSVAAEYGSQFIGSNVLINTVAPIDVLSFTLPSAGTWEVISVVRVQYSSAGYAAEFALYDPSGNLVPNSEILPAYGQIGSTGTGAITITTTGAGTYKLKAWASGAPTYPYNVTTDGNGRTGVTWKKISGNAPINAQRASGKVNAGSFVLLDNVKAGPTRTGAGGGYAGLSIGAVSTTFVADVSAMYSNSTIGGQTITGTSYTTTASNSWNGWGFLPGQQSTYILNDTTNNKVYRIILMIGDSSYNNNFVSIERLY